MEWLSEIRKLRKNVPVGIQVARRLLERTGGDVDEAIKLFHIDQINILTAKAGNDSNLLIVFYVQIMPDDFVMQLHRF